MTNNIEVFKQNSIRIKGKAGTVYIDPFKMNIAPHDADFCLITHDHYDHFSPEDIEKVSKKGTILVMPKKMEAKGKDVLKYVSRIETVNPLEFRKISWLEMEMIPSYNVSKQFHPKTAGWVGYILKIDGKRIYIAGDTDATDEARNVKCDVALVPIGGTYTMDAREAAELINEIKPETAIPTHYGDVVGKPEDGEVFKQNVQAPTQVQLECKL